MSAPILSPECSDSEHDICRGGETTPGVLGGWVCSCSCHARASVSTENPEGDAK